MIDISFERNGNKNCTVVKARIHTDLPVELADIMFEFSCGTQYASALLETYLNMSLQKAIETAHRNGYEQGWKDAKGRKAKAVTFAITFRKPNEKIAW